MNTALMFSSGLDETGTPKAFYNELDREFGFVIDVAALASNTKHPEYFGPDHPDPTRRDCLTINWPTYGPCFMNPPYSQRRKGRPGCYDFVLKAKSERMRGVTTVALLAARTDNRWFHEFIYNERTWSWRTGVSVRLLKGRLRFEGASANAPFPSMVVIFRP